MKKELLIGVLSTMMFIGGVVSHSYAENKVDYNPLFSKITKQQIWSCRNKPVLPPFEYKDYSESFEKTLKSEEFMSKVLKNAKVQDIDRANKKFTVVQVTFSKSGKGQLASVEDFKVVGDTVYSKKNSCFMDLK